MKPLFSVSAIAALALATLASEPVVARDGHKHRPPPPVPCAELATDPANGLLGDPAVKSVSSVIIAASGPNVSYCQVNLLYGTSPEQNINIRVGLPLNSADGGTGGVEGAWNGRTQGIGGGGCAGSLNVNAPVNAGYVGSGTDTGHTGGNCEPGVNEDGTYNFQFIQDFIRNAIKQQVLFSKSIARTYYAEKPAYNYWNGCSTGGRQGYLLAQELGKELDGDPRQRARDLLDPLPDGADVGADRHEGPGGRPDLRGQAQPGDRLGGRSVRCRRRRDRRRDRRPPHVQVQRDGEHLRHADRPGGELPHATGSRGDRQDLGRAEKREGQQGLVRARPRHEPAGPERHEPVRARRHAVPLEHARPQLRLADGHHRRLPAGRAGRLQEHRGRHRHLRRPGHVPPPWRQAAYLRRGERPAHHAARRDQLLPADGVPLRQARGAGLRASSRASIASSALPASPIAAAAPARNRRACSTPW